MSTQQVIDIYNVLNESTLLLMEEVGETYTQSLAETLENLVYNQTAQQIDGLPNDKVIVKLNHLYQSLSLKKVSDKQMQTAIQLAYLQAQKMDAIEPNLQMTPENIALLVSFFIQHLFANTQEIRMLDISVGSGNLLTIIAHQLKNYQLTLYGSEVDDVLVSIASNAFSLCGKDVKMWHQDSVQPLLIPAINLVVGDLPIGYYPFDDRASAFKVYAKQEHTYAHHLLIEHALQLLDDNGWGIFITPSNLFESAQAPLLLKLFNDTQYHVRAYLTLPEQLFAKGSQQKSILMVSKNKQLPGNVETLIGSVPIFKDVKKMAQFTNSFVQWSNLNV